MSDIRHSLLRRDALSAAKEVLYHLDIYFSSQLQSAPLPIVDKGPVELLEEFVFQAPKERGAQPKVRRADGGRGSARCSVCPRRGDTCWADRERPCSPGPFLAAGLAPSVASPSGVPGLAQLLACFARRVAAVSQCCSRGRLGRLVTESPKPLAVILRPRDDA